MSSLSLENINQRIREGEELEAVFLAEDVYENIRLLNIDWKTGSVSDESPIFDVLQKYNYISNSHLTKLGTLILARFAIDIEKEVMQQDIVNGKFKIIRKLHSGKNSCTFLAEHLILGTDVVLKFLRPGSADDLPGALRVVSTARDIESLIQPWDYFNTSIQDVFHKPVAVECLAFPYIQGTTLKEFLNNSDSQLNSFAIAVFIKQVSRVLSFLEEKHAYHGDLHDENIIVNTSKSGTLQFNIIDVSFGITGSSTAEICHDSDMQNFKQHVWNFLSAQQRFLTKMSLRKNLGAETYLLVTSIMLGEVKSFREIYGYFSNNETYRRYLTEKQQFIEKKFTPPGTFKLQRYEEITDQEVALKLFVPFPEMMQLVESFSNIIVSGTRGSGKSTYLAAVAFFPRASNELVNFRETFGIYFPCRQGEFRLLSGEMINYDTLGVSSVKPILILKIIRRTLEIIADAIEVGKLSTPPNYDLIKNIVGIFLENDKLISIETSIISEIKNIVATIVRSEMKAIDNLFHDNPSLAKSGASEITILEFFKAVRSTFRELSSTRFHLLFDDAGIPNIPREVQYMINDFIVSSNPIYCVKTSIEKNSYHYQTSNSKQIENGHDYFEYDINGIFYTGSKTFGLDDHKLESYFRSIIKNRLIHFGYQSDDIVEYLGIDQAKHENLVNSLAANRRNAYYCGWAMVWKIASGNPRNLLELISEIFSVANFDESTQVGVIPNRSQDRAIRSVSEKRLRSIGQISGTFKYHGKEYSLGKKLFDIALSVGSVFKIYLQAEKGKKRKDQYLAIERNDLTSLSEEAEFLLEQLIKFGIFDDSRLDVSRDDRVKKPIYILNRILCPVFGISYRRDQHLRLSRVKFEQLLTNPSAFVVEGTKRLRVQSSLEMSKQKTLFDEFTNE
ncbi:ORC-CDC6 family AAA ATPase [Dyadobacter sp. 22481]|uniref:ORC-CDC6 family AAA ATPase n=1 Tax=Dyadobacter sp. 22481 TaxID=3453926 RepID=UPI003F845F0E